MISAKWKKVLADPNLCQEATENFTKNFNSNFQKLSSIEKRIFRKILPNSGVLFIKGSPGSAKSSILRSIADKMGMLYIDLRLSQLDETDIGLYPDKIDINGNKYIDHVPPKWAYYTTLVPTLIAFEELNRCSKYVRNASMQLFMERAIGYDFIFNNNVYMVSTGNLGKEDNTEVEEFDVAQYERLLPMNYSITVKEWVDGYANGRVHSMIIKYLINNPTKLIEQSNNLTDKNASPRTWTQLSDYIITNYGKFDENGFIIDEPKLDDDIIDDIVNETSSYINAFAINNFINYVRLEYSVCVDDILNNYDEYKEKISKLNRDRISQLISELSAYDNNLLTENNINNIVKFFDNLGKSMDDEIAAYVHKLIKLSSKDNPKIYEILDRMKKYVIDIKNTHAKYRESLLK